MTQKKYEIGNITLKVKSPSVQLKVRKCPYIGCDKIFFRKADLYKHLQIDHGEMMNEIEENDPKAQQLDIIDSLDQAIIKMNKEHIKLIPYYIENIINNKPVDMQIKEPKPKPSIAKPSQPKEKTIIKIISSIIRRNHEAKADK